MYISLFCISRFHFPKLIIMLEKKNWRLAFIEILAIIFARDAHLKDEEKKLARKHIYLLLKCISTCIIISFNLSGERPFDFLIFFLVFLFSSGFFVIKVIQKNSNFMWLVIKSYGTKWPCVLKLLELKELLIFEKEMLDIATMRDGDLELLLCLLYT